MDQDKSDHHFRKGLSQGAWKISKVVTAISQTLFQWSLLNYFFVLFAVMVAAWEFIRVAQKGARMSFTVDWKVTQSNTDRINRDGARA
jgi:hypothetical protein